MARVRKGRKEIADEIAVAAVAFVMKARREGCSNRITTMCLLEVAEERGYKSYLYNVRTAQRLAREYARMLGVEHLVDFES